MKQEVSDETVELTQALHAPATDPAQCVDDEKKTTASCDVPFMLRAYMGLWSGALSGITVGALVFAPYRVSSAPLLPGISSNSNSSNNAQVTRPHYALAEVTGLQASAGTASVCFLFATPGVDDEAVSLYDLLPCPPAFLHRIEQQQQQRSSSSNSNSAREKSSHHNSCCHTHTAMSAAAATCSLLERLVGVRPQDGPVTAATAYAVLRSRDARHGVPSGPMTAQSVNTQGAQGEDGASVKCEAGQERPHSRKRTRRARDASRAHGGGAPGLASVLCLSDSDAEAGTRPCVRPQAEGLELDGDEEEEEKEDMSSTSEEEEEEKEDVKVYEFGAGRNVHCFFLDVFRRIDAAVWRAHGRLRRKPSAAAVRTSAAGAAVVALCVFDTYSVLHRFELFAALRGHRVRLLDGEAHPYSGRTTSTTTTNSSSSSSDDESEEYEDTSGVHGHHMNARQLLQQKKERAARGVCRGRLPRLTTPSAFGMVCKVWLCMLREDAMRAEQLRSLLQTAPPIDLVVHVYEDYNNNNTTTTTSDDDGSINALQSVQGCHDGDAASQRLCALLPHLHHASLRFYLRHLPPWMTGAPPPHPLYAARLTQRSQGTAPRLVAPPRLRVSGGVFANNKVLVPASREQLLLMQTVLCQGNNTAASAAQTLSAALLERIALGNFTDSATEVLFATGHSTVAVLAAPAEAHGRARYFSSVKELEAIFGGHAMRFGHVFPIFAAVLAILRDVFASPGDFIRHEHCAHARMDGTGRCAPELDAATAPILPRVALLFAQGNPAHQPQLTAAQFRRSLRRYLAPWQVYDSDAEEEEANADGVRAAHSTTYRCTTVLEWHRRGGVYVLHPDDARAALALLHSEADVVIACGKSAAAWVAAHSEAATSGDQHTRRSGCRKPPVYFAILSEIELVADVTRHLWMPFELDRADTTACSQYAPDDAHAEALHTTAMTADEEHLWRQLLAALPAAETSDMDKRYEQVPKVLQQSVILWHHLSRRQRSAGQCGSWQHLGQLVRRIALHCATYPSPISLTDLQLYSDT